MPSKTTNQHPAREEIRAILIDLARQGQTISYSDLCRMLETTRLIPRSPFLTRLLSEICDEERTQGRGKLCALVVRKSTGIPGSGYFAGIVSPGRDMSDLEASWLNDLEEVFGYWSSH